MNRVVAALAAVTAIIAAGPVSPAVASDITKCNNAYTESDLAACNRILKAGRLNGKPLTSQLKAIVLFKRGKARAQTGQYEGALEDFQNSLELNPNDNDVKEALALARQQVRSSKSIKSSRAPKNTKSLSEWEKAAAVLKKRGFSAKQAFSVLTSLTCGYYQTDCPIESYGPHNLSNMPLIIAARYGLSKKRLNNDHFRSAANLGDLVYDVQNGAHLAGMKPSEAARSVSKCYRRSKFHRSCKLRYHQMSGCRLTKRWARLCRKGPSNPVSGEFCYWVIKSDLPLMPSAKGTKSRVSLAKAKRKTRVAAVVRKKSRKLPKRPYCKEDQLPQ